MAQFKTANDVMQAFVNQKSASLTWMSSATSINPRMETSFFISAKQYAWLRKMPGTQIARNAGTSGRGELLRNTDIENNVWWEVLKNANGGGVVKLSKPALEHVES